MVGETLLESLKEEGSKYGWGLLLIRREELDRLVSFLIKRFGSIRVLDIGCFKCMLGSYLRGKFNGKVTYYGIDVLPFFEECREFSFNVMSGDALLFRPNMFHLVVFVESLEHIPNYVNALREAYRVLMPSGAVFIQSVKNDDPNAIADETHFHVLNPVTLKRLITYIGFRDVVYADGANFAIWGFK